MSNNFQDLKAGYQQLYDTCIINAARNAEIDAVVNKILANKPRYEAAVQGISIPWYFVGIVHGMEGSANFKTHLHNGDPLTAKTVHVPKNRPDGNPPFTWEVSAADALKYVGATAWTEWTIPGTLYNLEKYNGLGYRSRNINSPYLWSYSNHYTKGKFTGDNHFDPEAVSKQCGAAVLMKRIIEKQAGGTIPVTDPLAQIKQLGDQVIFDPGHFHANAEQLQKMLNTAGQHIGVDGKAGRNTSDAYFAVTGKFLKGDPKH